MGVWHVNTVIAKDTVSVFRRMICRKYIIFWKEAEMLVASHIYYHGISGQLKCVIDRFYSAAYPRGPKNLKKVAMILSSGDANMMRVLFLVQRRLSGLSWT